MRATPLLALALVGCFTQHGGGQIGEEVGAECRAVGATPLADDEVSALGFAPAELLALAAPYDGPFRYAEGGETPLHLSVAPDGGAELVDYEIVDPSGGGGAEPALTCADRLEIPVLLAFETEDGAFALEVAARLGGESAAAAGLWARLAGSGGTFDPAALAPDADAVHLDLAASWDAAGSAGAVTVQAERTRGDVASAELLEVGAWPSPR